MECPVCKARMHHEKVEEIWADICKEHGVWLDKGELERIMESIKHKGKHEGLAEGLYHHMHDTGSMF